LKEPQNDKFRVLKKSNKAIAAKLLSLKPVGKVLELLTLLGYVEMDEDLSAFVGEYYAGLIQGAKQIEDASMNIKMLTMSEDERKKVELIRKEKEEFLVKQKAKKAE